MEIQILKPTRYALRDGKPCLLTIGPIDAKGAVKLTIALRVVSDAKTVVADAKVDIKSYVDGSADGIRPVPGSPFTTDNKGKIEILLPSIHESKIKRAVILIKYGETELTCGLLPPNTEIDDTTKTVIPPRSPSPLFVPGTQSAEAKHSPTRSYQEGDKGWGEVPGEPGVIPEKDVIPEDSAEVFDPPVIFSGTDDESGVPNAPLEIRGTEPTYKPTLMEGRASEVRGADKPERFLGDPGVLAREREALDESREETKALIDSMTEEANRAFTDLQTKIKAETTDDEASIEARHEAAREQIRQLVFRAKLEMRRYADILPKRIMHNMVREAGNELERLDRLKILGYALMVSGSLATVYLVIWFFF